jgi:TolB protein
MRENGHWDIWVMDVDGSAQRQLTMDPGDEHAPTWSGDGRQIYFSSDSGGGRDIWRVPAAGGPAQRVTRGGSGAVAYEAPEGKAIVYQTRMGDSPLVMLSLAGKPPRQLVACVKSQGFVAGRRSAIGASVYYAPCGPGPQTSVHLLESATGRDRVVANVSEPFFVNGLTVSPDGNTILVHRGAETADLVLIENFQ